MAGVDDLVRVDPAEGPGDRTGKSSPGIKYHPESFNMKLRHGMWCVESVREGLLDDVMKFPMTPSDVMVVSYPKSGVFWMAEVLYAMHHGSDIAANQKVLSIGLRVPFLEHSNDLLRNPLGLLASRPPPRLCKSHLAADFFKSQLENDHPKVVVLLRNPKDALAACYRWYTANNYFVYPGTFDEFFQLFKGKLLVEGDIVQTTLSWWRLRHHDNVHILKYEDMAANPKEQVQKMAEFCGCKLSGNDFDNLSNFVENKMAQDGGIGMWREYFSSDNLEYMDTQVVRAMAKEGLVFSDADSS